MKKIFCAITIVVCLVGYTCNAAPLSEVEEKIFAPHELPKAFAENPDATKAQYMGKTVLIKGIVVDKGMSVYMTPYVALSESGKEPTPARCVLPYIGIAYWNRSGQLSDFEIGQTVIMSGRVHNLNENRVLLKESKVFEY
jgi:hypothetical protein